MSKGQPDMPTKIHCNWVMAGPDEVWVIKLASGRYLRWLTTGHALGVKRSLATRFDSPSWAATMLTAIPADAGAKIRRLRAKSTISTWTAVIGGGGGGGGGAATPTGSQEK